MLLSDLCAIQNSHKNAFAFEILGFDDRYGISQK